MTVRDYNFLVDEQLKKNALEYHRRKPAGKISVLPTKQLTNQRDLGLAYTPGVAAACEEIVRDPAQAFDMTSRANLIAVVTNGTAVLGLGAIGPLAASDDPSEPIMTRGWTSARRRSASSSWKRMMLPRPFSLSITSKATSTAKVSASTIE